MRASRLAGMGHTQSSTATTPDLEQRRSFGSAAADTSLSESLATLRKRKWVLILAAALGIVVGLYRAYTQPKIYDANSIIQVREGASNEYKLTADYDFSGDSQEKLNTEIQILKSESLMIAVGE